MPEPKQDDPEQSARFKELAEKLEAKGDPKAFMKRVREIASASREPPKTKKG